jgi:hypothetical protein
MKSRFNSGIACYHSVQNLLSSRLLSRNIKIRIYCTGMAVRVGDNRLSHSIFHSLYLFPTSPSVLHYCRARTLELANSRTRELSNRRLSNPRTVDSRTLEPSTLDLFYSSPSRLANRFLIARSSGSALSSTHSAWCRA